MNPKNMTTHEKLVAWGWIGSKGQSLTWHDWVVFYENQRRRQR